MKQEPVKSEPKNEIVVYQPNETLRLEVLVENESVWLTQSKIGELFGVDRTVINRHIHNIYKTGELKEAATCAKIAQVQNEGGRQITRVLPFYDLDMIIAVGYRVNSFEATQFRIWATHVLRDYLLNGLAVNRRYDSLALEMDRRLADHDTKLIELRKDVDYFISSSLPPKEMVFVEGKMLDAQAELTRIVKTAKRRIVLIDNYIDERTLMLLGNRRTKVSCAVYTLRPNSPKLAPALANYAKDYPMLPIAVKGYKKSHDRFLIVDNTVWHVGASLKDAGSALFAMMKMELDPAVILGLLP